MAKDNSWTIKIPKPNKWVVGAFLVATGLTIEANLARTNGCSAKNTLGGALNPISAVDHTITAVNMRLNGIQGCASDELPVLRHLGL